MITCPECGRELPDGTRFCPSCGQACNRTSLKVQRRSQMDVAKTMPVGVAGAQSPGAARGQAGRDGSGTAPSGLVEPAGRQAPGRFEDASSALPHTGRTAEAFVPAYAPQAARQASAAAGSAGVDGDRKRKRRRTVVMASVLGAVLIAIIVAVAAWAVGANRQAATAAQQATHDVTFRIDAPGYDPDADSPIPVRVSGTDADGAKVDAVFYLGPDDSTVQLRQGSYTASVAASPLLDGGGLYAVPDGLIDVQVREDGVSGIDSTWSFTEMEPADITDDQIEASYDAAIDSGMDASRAGELRQAVLDARQAALDEQAAEDQADADRRAAQARRQAQSQQSADANRFDDGYVSLDVPSTWLGNYEASTEGHASGAFHTEFYLAGSDFLLLRIDGTAGDLGTYDATYGNSATEIWDSAHGGSPYSQADLESALNLQTGGSLTPQDVLSCASGEEAQALGEQYIGYFMDANIAPTVGVG